jgi:hypothetical protein
VDRGTKDEEGVHCPGLSAGHKDPQLEGLSRGLADCFGHGWSSGLRALWAGLLVPESTQISPKEQLPLGTLPLKLRPLRSHLPRILQSLGPLCASVPLAGS